MCHLKYLAVSYQIFYFRRFSLILWKRCCFLMEYRGEKSPNWTTFLENDTKKINALLWFKTWKCFKLKLLPLKICHLYWNHRTSKHRPTRTHTSETGSLLLFGLCHLLTILPFKFLLPLPQYSLLSRGDVCHLTLGMCCLCLEPSQKVWWPSCRSFNSGRKWDMDFSLSLFSFIKPLFVED